MNADPLRAALAARKILGRPWPKICSVSTWVPARRPTPRFLPRICCSTSRLRRPPRRRLPLHLPQSPRGPLPSKKNPRDRRGTNRDGPSVVLLALPVRSASVGASPRPRRFRGRPRPRGPFRQRGRAGTRISQRGAGRTPGIDRERTASSTPRARGAAGAAAASRRTRARTSPDGRIARADWRATLR